MEEYKYKLDAKLVTVNAGTAADTTTEITFQPDSSYNEVVGVEAYEVSDGGSAYYRLGIKDEDKSYVALSHKNCLLSSAAVDQRGKMRQVNIPVVKDRDLKFQVKNGGLLATDLKVEFVLTLRKRVVATE